MVYGVLVKKGRKDRASKSNVCILFNVQHLAKCFENIHNGLHRHIQSDALYKDAQRWVAFYNILDRAQFIFDLLLLLRLNAQMLLKRSGVERMEPELELELVEGPVSLLADIECRRSNAGEELLLILQR